MNSAGPEYLFAMAVTLLYNRKCICSKVNIWDRSKRGDKFLPYLREFIKNVIIIAEFDCTSKKQCIEVNKMKETSM